MQCVKLKRICVYEILLIRYLIFQQQKPTLMNEDTKMLQNRLSSCSCPPHTQIAILQTLCLLTVCPQNKSLSPNNTHPQHPAPPKLSCQLLKRKHPAAAVHTQKFASVISIWLQRPEVMHGSLNQLWTPFDPNAYGVSAFPNQVSAMSVGQLSRVSCSDLRRSHTYIYTHMHIFFWRNGAKDDVIGNSCGAGGLSLGEM